MQPAAVPAPDDGGDHEHEQGAADDARHRPGRPAVAHTDHPQAGQPVPVLKPILEVNPSHALVRKLQSESDGRFEDLAHVLFDQAQLAEGGLPEDPAAYVRRVNALLA